MKKLSALLILLFLPVLPLLPQTRFANTYGFPVPLLAGATVALNSSASGGFSQSWLTFGLYPDATRTISKIRVYATAVSGTLASTDLVCDVYSDASGVPSSSLASSSTVTATPTAAAWVEFTGFSLSVTANTQYWIVMRNANASPASNAPTYRYFTNLAPATFPMAFGGTTVKTSTNSGGSWSNQAGSVGAFRIEYSGSVFAGYPFEASVSGASLSSNERIYSTREVGVTFTTGANFAPQVSAVAFSPMKTNTPTGSLGCKLYSDNGTTATLVATSANSYPATNVNTTTSSQWMLCSFSSTQALSPSTVYRVVAYETTQSDASTIYYSLGAVQMTNDSASLSLLPIGGTLRGNYCTGTCTTSSNWVVVYNIPGVALVLDPAGEFASQGGSSGPHNTGTAH